MIKPLRDLPHIRLLLWLMLGLVLLGVAALALTHALNSPADNPQPSVTSGEITTDGELACLPHRATDGPVTQECAYGLRTDAGHYYALNTLAFSSSVLQQLAIGDAVSVTGIYTPASAMHDETISTYAIDGSIAVKDIDPK
jgi:hypothetical protein